MARYSSEHKQLTRRRIVETAGRRLKRDGIDASGVAGLMSDAGLTNGAFYGHFTSKNDLVAGVVTAQLADQAETMRGLPATPEAVTEFIRFYLSPEHRDNPADGCPNAALLDQIRRCEDSTRRAYTEGVRVLVDVIADRLAAPDRDTAERRALGALTGMVASLQLARAVTDAAWSDYVLRCGVENALTILDLPSAV